MPAIYCLSCGEHEICLDLVSRKLTCENCDWEDSVEGVEKAIAVWAAWLPWLKSGPQPTTAEA